MEVINKITNGDCLNVLKELDDNVVDLVVTDPPFNMAYSGRGKKNKFDGFANDDLSPEEHSAWLESILKETHRVLKEDSSLYIFVDFRNYARFYQSVEKYFNIKHCIVWDKESIGMGYYYRFQHEFIIYAHKGKGKKLNFPMKNVPDIIKAKRVGRLNHPTQKPTDLIETLIKHSSVEGDLVLDMFAGSFTTAIACANTNRNFICTELDNEYCKIGEERLSECEKEEA
jgi:site-specific DNA-methyltransferase (adenine-specific)